MMLTPMQLTVHLSTAVLLLCMAHTSHAEEASMAAFLMRATPVLAKELVSTYAPAADVLISAAAQRMGWPMALMQFVGAVEEEEPEVVNPYAARYTQFIQDRSSKGSQSDTERLLKHGYDKYRYVSQAFLDRNPLPEAEQTQAFSSAKTRLLQDSENEWLAVPIPRTLSESSKPPKPAVKVEAARPSVQQAVRPTGRSPHKQRQRTVPSKRATSKD